MHNVVVIHNGKRIPATVNDRSNRGNYSVNIAHGQDGKDYQFIRFADGVVSKVFCRTPKGGVA